MVLVINPGNLHPTRTHGLNATQGSDLYQNQTNPGLKTHKYIQLNHIYAHQVYEKVSYHIYVIFSSYYIFSYGPQNR